MFNRTGAACRPERRRVLGGACFTTVLLVSLAGFAPLGEPDLLNVAEHHQGPA